MNLCAGGITFQWAEAVGKFAVARRFGRRERIQKPKKSHKEVRVNSLEFNLFDSDRYAAYVFVWGKCSPFLSVFPVSGRRGLLN